MRMRYVLVAMTHPSRVLYLDIKHMYMYMYMYLYTYTYMYMYMCMCMCMYIYNNMLRAVKLIPDSGISIFICFILIAPELLSDTVVDTVKMVQLHVSS